MQHGRHPYAAALKSLPAGNTPRARTKLGCRMANYNLQVTKTILASISCIQETRGHGFAAKSQSIPTFYPSKLLQHDLQHLASSGRSVTASRLLSFSEFYRRRILNERLRGFIAKATTTARWAQKDTSNIPHVGRLHCASEIQRQTGKR